MVDKEKEEYSMDFLGEDEVTKEKTTPKSKKVVKSGTDNSQGSNKIKSSASRRSGGQGGNNKNTSINKELNITKIIEIINNNIDSKFNILLDTIKNMKVDDDNLNEYHYNILKEYTTIRNSIIKLRKSGRVKQAIDKLDKILGVK